MGIGGVGTAQVAVIVLIAVACAAMIGRFELFCLRDLAAAPDLELRYLTRRGWIGVILLAIPLGGILYLSCGRTP